MKWVFLLALILGTPALAALLRSKPSYIVPTCFLLGPALFILAPLLWAAPISWPAWPGPARGLYVSVIDGVSIALIAATHRARTPTPVKVAFAIYCLGLILSGFSAQINLWPVIFYAGQVLRTALLFVAIARVCATVERAPIALVAGMSVGVMVEAVMVPIQFAQGVYRPGGTFGNANYTGLSLDYVVFPAIALMLGTRRTVWPAITGVAALVIAVCGGSRATLGLIAAGLMLTVVVSILHRKTSRKFTFAGATALLLLVATPALLWGANQRSQSTLDSSDQMRTSMKLAARMIIADYPFGIGANSYVVFANARGYNDRAGVAWNAENRAVPVHNTYYLVTAEMGVIGLIGLLSILASLIVLACRMMGRQWQSENAELVPGLLVTMIMASVHIAFEFVMMDFILHYFFAIAAGMLIGLHAQAAQARRVSRPRPIQSEALVAAG